MIDNIIKLVNNKAFGTVLVIVLVIIIIVFLFLKLWLPFGGTVTKDDVSDYSKRAKNYKNGKFYNENEFEMIYSNPSKNYYVSNKKQVPENKIKSEKLEVLGTLENELSITWLGHSSTLIQMHGLKILIDPVFSECSSPVSFIGPKRFSELPQGINDLSKIDIVIITHDHYDHLDYNTIKMIDSKVSKYVVPLGVENHLERWGITQNKIVNMAWWEEINVDGLTIGCTPARHYSRRGINDSYKTLWASFVLLDEHYKVFNSGDTGFQQHFAEIHDKYGDFDLALIDTGQYDTRWKSTHMVPEEAVEAGKMLKAKTIMPIHWGTFKLANHPWDDAVERFTQAAERENQSYITPKIGETVNLNREYNNIKWWQNLT